MSLPQFCLVIASCAIDNIVAIPRWRSRSNPRPTTDPLLANRRATRVSCLSALHHNTAPTFCCVSYAHRSTADASYANVGRTRRKDGGDLQRHLKEVKKERQANAHRHNDVAAHYAVTAQGVSAIRSICRTRFRHTHKFVILNTHLHPYYT